MLHLDIFAQILYQMNRIVLFAAALVLGISSCKKDDPVDPQIPNEEEVITTLTMKANKAILH